MPNYSFDMPPGIDPTDDGSRSLPAYLGQALQFYGTDKSTDLPYSYSYPLNNQPGQSMFGGGVPMQPPVAQAMAPQAPDTPVAQAMAPQAPPDTPMAQAMGYPNSEAIQAMFAKQATDPNLAMNNGLIAAGSAMLGGKNLQEGMANAGKAWSDTFDSTLNGQRDLNTPKVTPIADGAFSQVQLPGQPAQIIPSAQVQNYLLDKVQLQGQIGMQKALAAANFAVQRDQAKDDRANSKQYGNALVQTETAMQANDRALAVAEAQAKDPTAWPRMAAMFPQIAQALGSDSAAGNLVIQRAHIDAALVQDMQKKGALTNDQMNFLNADIPSPTADREKVIIPFLRQQKAILEEVHKFQQEQYSKANPNPVQGFATSGTSNVQRPASTGTGNQPVQVSSFAEAAKLPSGTVFLDPNGNPRKVP
jgi:type II secretory pathway pseudopilin PulG